MQLSTDKIRIAMIRQGYSTQAELAVALSVSRVTVGRWMRGKNIPHPEQLIKLAAVLNLSIKGLVK